MLIEFSETSATVRGLSFGKKYFGQNGEDFLVWSLFSGDEPGFFVDVGSFDGIHLSNSYSFELAGWDGICVEAHPEYFPHLKKNRPKSRTVWSACVEPGASSEIEFLTEPLGLVSALLIRRLETGSLFSNSRDLTSLSSTRAADRPMWG